MLPLLDPQGNASNARVKIKQLQNAIFVFKADLNGGKGAWLFQQGVGIGSFVPVEAMVELCNKLGVNFWYTINYLYNDDSVTELATYVARRLSPQLTAYFEYGNEVWNWAFSSTRYALNMAAALGLVGRCGQLLRTSGRPSDGPGDGGLEAGWAADEHSKAGHGIEHLGARCRTGPTAIGRCEVAVAAQHRSTPADRPL